MMKAKDRNRAPEEMMVEDDQDGGNPVSEKIDVYSMGNIFYHFITDHKKYENMDLHDAQALILQGHVPWIVSSLLNASIHVRNSSPEQDEIESSSDKNEVDIILARAVQMCLKREPDERASAREVADFLRVEYEQYRIRHIGATDVYPHQQYQK